MRTDDLIDDLRKTVEAAIEERLNVLKPDLEAHDIVACVSSAYMAAAVAHLVSIAQTDQEVLARLFDITINSYSEIKSAIT